VAAARRPARHRRLHPCRTWPPTYEGKIDTIRLHWLDHPDLHTTQVNGTQDAATLLATYLPGKI
jgi:hypothetical protein